jgi:phosphatidylglycerophosphatase A
MKRLFASCFGLGRLPLAPGTWGSLPPTIIFALLCQFGVCTPVVSVVMTALVVIGSVLCVRFAPAAIAATGKTDPREVVADELAGQGLTFAAVPLLVDCTTTYARAWAIAGAGFVLFRIFDIAKPWPIRKLEKLSQGWGVLADDLLAGIYAAAVLLIGARLVLIP